jgi:hypothetical protein
MGWLTNNLGVLLGFRAISAIILGQQTRPL